MALNSFSKGYVLSSTPLQSPEDSGYFGSSQRRYKSNANALSYCSPIEESKCKNSSEYFPLKCDFSEVSPETEFEKKHLNNDFLSVSGIEINGISESEFTNSNVTKILPSFPEKQKSHDLLLNTYEETRFTRHYFDSLSKDSDIKYKLFDFDSSDLPGSSHFKCSTYLNGDLSQEKDSGISDSRSIKSAKQIKVDFIYELNKSNCLSIVSYILSCLSAKELCTASCVSKEWNQVVQHDKTANSRREIFIRERFLFFHGPSKENRRGMKNGPAREHKEAFSDLTNAPTTHHPVTATVSNAKFDSFIKEAANGKSRLRKCPRCCFASKCLDGNNYMCTKCSYKFCSHCLNPIFSKHSCKYQQLSDISSKKSIIVGSRKSKKNLKRL